MENETPNTNSNPLENALRQIQSWFVEGEFEKVKKGCREILQAVPNNSIAQDLLKKAEEQEAKQKQPLPKTQETPIDTAPATEPELPSPFPSTAVPKPIATSIPTMPMATPTTSAHQIPTPEIHHGRSLVVNIAILLGLLLLGIGLVYGYTIVFNQPEPSTTEEAEEETAEENSEETTEEETQENEAVENVEEVVDLSDLEARNEQRLSDLTEIETALQGYYAAHHNYPDTESIGTVLVEEGFLDELPLSPSPGEVYFYAVFDNDIDEQQVYILTAQIENEDGSLGEWSTGGSIQEFPDYKTVELENVTILHPTLDEAAYFKTLGSEETTDTPETTETEENSGRVPRT